MKIITNKRGEISVFILGVFFVSFMAVLYCFSWKDSIQRDVQRANYYALKSGTKASLTKLLVSDKNISLGYIDKNINQNNQLNKEEALKSYYDLYYSNMRHYLKKDEKKAEEKTTLVLVEKIGDKLFFFLYKGTTLFYTCECNNMLEIQNIINNNLSYVKIKLVDDGENVLVDASSNTCIVAIIEGLEIKGTLINTFYFEGSKMERGN